MKSFIPLKLHMFAAVLSLAVFQTWATENQSYTLVVSGFDWGAGANKVIIPSDDTIDNVDASNYRVNVVRSTELMELAAQEAHGERPIVHAYVSDTEGNPVDEGNNVTLVLYVAPNDPLSSPMKYIWEAGRRNYWMDYQLIILELDSGRVFHQEGRRIRPIVDSFSLDGKYEHPDGTRLSYADYKPKNEKTKWPLIIWLHGGGEGGTDPSIPLLANRATSYASAEIQALFQGAYVLVAQTPTRWMHSVNGGITTGQYDDIYYKALMGLIQNYVTENPNIDTDRIYVGGCSNGGYMSLKLIIENPNYFAASFISAIAYFSEYLTDDQVELIKDMPIWFVHSADDDVTKPEDTILPIYERLKNAGADNMYLSYYDHVVDITGLYGGDAYRYNGHLSWIYHHANKCTLDYDGTPVMINGKPVTIMEWLAGQSR